MNKPFLFFCASLVALTVLLTGCKKESKQNDGPQIVFEKQDYYPLEVALITVKNTTVSDGQYTGSIDGNNITVVAVNGYLGTVMPVLNAGTHRLIITVSAVVFLIYEITNLV